MMRGTGGNRFIEADATRGDLLASINDQLGDIHQYAVETGRVLNLAEVTISTQRIKSGRISVNVSADLPATDTATEWWHCLTCGWLNKHNDPEHDGCGECGKRQEMHP